MLRPLMFWLLNPFLFMLAIIYDQVTHLRNLAYDRGLLSVHQIRENAEVAALHRSKVGVLGIGNLTAGGTGKTPITAFLTQQWLQRGFKVAIMSRGYRSSGEFEVARVPVANGIHDAELFGDEPVWLANRFPQVPVYVGANKVRVAQELLEHDVVDVILVDDAFQHRRLARQFDLVILDATEDLSHYRSLPLGRLRERFSGIRRANAVFITKTNLADPERIKILRDRLSHALLGLKVPVYEFVSVIREFRHLRPLQGMGQNTKQAAQPSESHMLTHGALSRVKLAAGDRVLLVSGIGRPETFDRAVRAACDVQIVDHLAYRDHHHYSDRDFRQIEARALELNATSIIVTEKDAVKMIAWQSQVPVLVSMLESEPLANSGENLGEFFENAARCLF